MQRDQLDKLKYIKKEIENLQQQLQEAVGSIDKVSDTVKGSSSTFPYQERVFGISGFDTGSYHLRLEKIENRLTKRVDDLINTLEDITSYIDKIESDEMRVIIQYRFMRNFTWREIAKELGYQDESAPRKKFDRFICNNEIDR